MLHLVLTSGLQSRRARREFDACACRCTLLRELPGARIDATADLAGLLAACRSEDRSESGVFNKRATRARPAVRRKCTLGKLGESQH